MADKRIVKSIQQYLQVVKEKGIPVKYGVPFGSHARGQEHEWSDIDLLVVSPLYEKHRNFKDIVKLWRIAAQTYVRIEPIPVGEEQFKNDKDSMIAILARREGQIIYLAK